MFRHYLVTALRSFARHKLYTFINIAGVGIGLACAILITLYVRDELSYDSWLPDTQNVYRLETTFHIPGRDPVGTGQAPFPVVTALQQQIPQVQAATHVMREPMTLSVADRQFRETATVVDPNFLGIIKLPLLQGDPGRVLAQPESVVLSRSEARKLFGDADPVGKVLNVVMDRNVSCAPSDNACLSASYPLTVTGVLRDLPYNTQLAVDLLIPNISRVDEISPREKATDWMAGDGDIAYVKLEPGATPAAVLAALKRILDRSFDPRALGTNLSASEFETNQLTPLQEAHLTSDRYYGMTPAGSWAAVYGLSVIAVLIVLIACFNFMNLATARATLRAKEIALRKLGGATRWQLVGQFLGEAVLMVLIALVIALAVVETVLPVYDQLVGKPIRLNYATDWRLLLLLIAGTAVIGILSGLYPAAVLAAFRPASALKAGASVRGTPSLLRSVLVIAQFAISIGLAVTALVVLRQIDFARRVDLGFHHDGIVILRNITRLTPEGRTALAHTLSTYPGIVAVAYSNAVPLNMFNTSNELFRVAGDPQSVPGQEIDISPEFPALYGMGLLAGRLLSAARGEDLSTREGRGNLLMNATAVRRLGMTAEKALGSEILLHGKPRGQVVGILSDANLNGIRQAILPAIYFFDTADSHSMTLLSVRLRGDRVPEALDFIDKTWRAHVAGTAIDRYFLADTFNSQFESDVRQGQILGMFVSISIFIACLGLFGLAVFTAERRTKEIGVRKISGARTVDIVQRLLWQISIPVLIANLIAWPLAYYYLTRWLETYAYRISLNPLYFLAAGAIALLIAWATVLAHAVRLARASPINALRYE
ncbi:MAG TPA: ABC transporter permease [Steroidobacteraceae bacterium]